uniref:Laminin EGF-like domain-containing protein n=1 Tax=Monopterus albus TaxID=43700 RepID=A0A3Q3IKK8_MONAL
MTLTSLMMYISSVRLFTLCVYIGFSTAAPRISQHDASPISRIPGSASDTWETFHTDMPRTLPERFAPGPQSGITPSPAIVPTGPTTTANPVTKITSIFQLPTTNPTTTTSTGATSILDTGIISDTKEQIIGICNCSSGAEGILDPDDCEQGTGQCLCLAGYSGLQCEDCEEGYFTNGTSGCLPCTCDSFGAVNHLCDSSGICVCKTGVYGPKCDECHPGFFHFSSTGCRPCQHSLVRVCLNCEDNTQGSNCEECKPGFYRSPRAALTGACAPCPCSTSTSTGTCRTDPSGSAVCDQCLHLYSGPQCDKCSAGFYKTSGTCVPCDCSGNADPQRPAQLCHPDTGHCFHCINNTAGPQCQLCAPGFIGDGRAHNCTPDTTTPEALVSNTSSPSTNTSTSLSAAATTQALLTSLSSPTDNTTAALTEVSWTQFNIIILAVIILVVLLLLGFVGGVYTYREYQNRKLNAPFWTIELKEDNISFSSYHDSIPNADVSGLLEDEATEVAPNGQLALTTQGNCYKA